MEQKQKESCTTSSTLTLAHLRYNISSIFQKGIWSSNYIQHFFFPFSLQMWATDDCINGMGQQEEAQHSSSLSFLCQANTPHQRKKYTFTDPFKNKLPWNKWASQLLTRLWKSKQWNMLDASTLCRFSHFPVTFFSALELPDMTPSCLAHPQPWLCPFPSPTAPNTLVQKTHKHPDYLNKYSKIYSQQHFSRKLQWGTVEGKEEQVLEIIQSRDCKFKFPVGPGRFCEWVKQATLWDNREWWGL